MKKHLHHLFIPHRGNNHKPKILHHNSLAKFVLLVLFFQLMITSISQIKPGVLGFASNISTNEIIALTNQKRLENNQYKLKFSPVLSESARRKAVNMFANNYWAHNAPDGTTPWYFFKKVGYGYLYAGENLARDFGDSQSVVDAWMDSPTHRENLLSGRYTEIGVAVVNGMLDGEETTLVVQHFGKPSSVASVVSSDAAVDVKEDLLANNRLMDNLSLPSQNASEVVDDIKSTTPINAQLNNEFKARYPEMTLGDKTPILSSFDITKSVNIALLAVISIGLFIDGYMIWKKRIIRRSGKSFAHLAFIILVILIILLTKSGNIL